MARLMLCLGALDALRLCERRAEERCVMGMVVALSWCVRRDVPLQVSCLILGTLVALTQVSCHVVSLLPGKRSEVARVDSRNAREGT